MCGWADEQQAWEVKQTLRVMNLTALPEVRFSQQFREEDLEAVAEHLCVKGAHEHFSCFAVDTHTLMEGEAVEKLRQQVLEEYKGVVFAKRTSGDPLFVAPSGKPQLNSSRGPSQSSNAPARFGGSAARPGPG